MKLLTSIFLLMYGYAVMTASTVHAQVTVLIEEIAFQSAAEEQFFQRLSAGEQVDSASAIWMPGVEDPAAAMQAGKATLKDFADGLRPKIAKKKTLPEKVELVDLELKQRFLLKPLTSATLVETLESGTFSVFSATALYALVLEQLDLPFEIRMEGEHAFIRVLTAPATILEVCPPKQGNLHPLAVHDQFAFRKIGSALVQKDARLRRRLDSVPEGRISIGQLAGLQYIAHGQRAYARRDWDAARNQFQKGFLLFPMELTAVAVWTCYVSSARTLDESDFANFDDLLRAYSATPTWAWEGEVAAACEKTTYNMAFANLEKVSWDQVEWKMFEASLPAYGTPCVRFGYLAAASELAMQKLQWRKAYTTMRELYHLDPYRETVRENLVGSFLQNFEEYIDYGVLADSIRAFTKAFPGVLDEAQENEFWLIHWGSDLSRAADNNDHRALPERYTQFLHFIDQLKPLPQQYQQPSCETLERVFMYQFRKADYPQARTVLKQALDRFPDSETLLRIKEVYGKEIGFGR